MSQAAAEQKVLVADVVLDARVGGREAVYTYLLDRPAFPGEAFLVPLGPRAIVGYVIQSREADEEQLGFSISRLRPVGAKIEGLSLPDPLMRLVEFVAEEYLCPLPVSLGAALPPGVLQRLETTWVLDEDPRSTPFELTQAQKEVLQALKDSGGTLVQAKGKRFSPVSLAALKSLRAKGLVRQELSLAAPEERRDSPTLLRLTPDSDRVEDFLRKHAKKRPAQALTLLRLQEVEHPALTAADIKSLCGVTDQTLKALQTARLLEPVDPKKESAAQPPIPNAHQQLAIDAITEAVLARDPKGFLLFGVTGSGKTEVYLRCAAEALRQGRQTLYLVPEIALATQAVSLLRERFGRRVAVIHSDLPPRERLDNWAAIRKGEAAIVIGARSALFAPLSDIGLIVVDEEHEASYKQETSPRYHAKRLVRRLAELHRCPVVFGSATPSVETFHEAETEILTLLSMPQRAADAKLPSVYIEDLAAGFRQGKPSLFTDSLLEALEKTLQRGEQAILFLNRRFYAPFLICRDCGETFKCPQCAVSLAYSRRLGKLRCHHCDYQMLPPEVCPNCKGSRIRPFGVGTEKVEEAVAEAFPEASVARLDRDVAQKRGQLESVLAGFASGQTQVLVGTQMVAKGLNFPNVTLVGVIAADVSLNIPDFRSSERTFQLLSQVAGRAGRGKSPGHVVVQTFNPGHTAVTCAQSHDFLAFYEDAKTERREAGYPPFRRLVNIVFSGEERAAVERASREARGLLEGALGVEALGVGALGDRALGVGELGARALGVGELGVGELGARALGVGADSGAEILGPVDCALERLSNRWRRHLLIKLPPEASVLPIGEALADFAPKGVMTVLDVDPHSLM